MRKVYFTHNVIPVNLVKQSISLQSNAQQGQLSGHSQHLISTILMH